jgi:hypothetical protein
VPVLWFVRQLSLVAEMFFILVAKDKTLYPDTDADSTTSGSAHKG